MKLHLPKSLLVAVLATMVSFTQSAWGIDLLESEAGWTFSQGRTYGLPSYDENNKSISTVNNWGQNYATYELGAFLEASEGEAGKLSFSFTLTTSNTVDSMAGIAFVGSQQALVMGSPEYKKNDVGYSLSSNVHADIYTAENWGSATTTANTRYRMQAVQAKASGCSRPTAHISSAEPTTATNSYSKLSLSAANSYTKEPPAITRKLPAVLVIHQL